MLESADSRQVRQAWRAFAGSFRAYKLSNQDEIRVAVLKKERAHLQGIYNRTVKSMKRSDIQKAFSRTRRMLHESRQLAQAQRKLLRMELKAKRVRQLDADKLDEDDMRKVGLEAHNVIARLTVSTQQPLVGSSQAARKQAKKTVKQAVKTLKRLITQHNSPQEKMCVERHQAMMIEVTIRDSTGERTIEHLADSGSERCVSHKGIMHETIKEYGIQGTPLNMVTASGERVGILGATPGTFSFPTSDQPDTVFTHPFQIMPSSMTPIIGVDFWAKYNADKSYSRNTITIQRTGVDKNMGLGGRPPYHLKSAQGWGRHHLKWPFSFFLFMGLVGYLHPINPFIWPHCVNRHHTDGGRSPQFRLA